MLNVETIRRDFLNLSRQVNGKPLVYLENCASAQKPQVVIDAISQAYSQQYANVHCGLHTLSSLATDNYERVCGIVARFLGAASEDEIILSIMQHHANIVPWHFLRERHGVVIKWIEVDNTGALDPVKVLEAITPRTRLIAVTHCSNVLGTVVDAAAICAGAQSRGVPVLIDGNRRLSTCQ